MAREPRIEVPGTPFHLIVRGNNKMTIFPSEACYLRYIELLKGYKERHHYKLHCYCLMPSHIHLILESSQAAPISKIMQCINTSYTLYFNRKFNRTGHVLEGRYKSKLINDDRYLLYLSGYIHMNPVKAQLCQNPQDYRYSSCRNYIGEADDDFVNTSFILNILNEDVNLAKREYKTLLDNWHEMEAAENKRTGNKFDDV